MGNGMQSFISAFSLSLVANHTLVWLWLGYGPGASRCDSYIHRADWMRYLNLTEPMDGAAAQCPFAVGEGDATLESHIACRGVQAHPCQPTARVISTTARRMVRYNAQEASMLGLLARNGNLAGGTDMQASSRAWDLFALGPHYAYGRLFASAFHFDFASVHSPARDALLGAGLQLEMRDELPYYYEAHDGLRTGHERKASVHWRAHSPSGLAPQWHRGDPRVRARDLRCAFVSRLTAVRGASQDPA